MITRKTNNVQQKIDFPCPGVSGWYVQCRWVWDLSGLSSWAILLRRIGLHHPRRLFSWLLQRVCRQCLYSLLARYCTHLCVGFRWVKSRVLDGILCAVSFECHRFLVFMSIYSIDFCISSSNLNIHFVFLPCSNRRACAPLFPRILFH